jgi:hypothetical protein
MLESGLGDVRKLWTVGAKDEAVITGLHNAPP